ncbi:MAG: hypothetical protein RR840_03875 [Clostridium sp.]
MKQQLEDNNSCNAIRITKISGEKSQDDDTTKASAIFSLNKELITKVSKKLQVFLKENNLSGGVMDMNISTFEVDIINKISNDGKSADLLIIDFIDSLREEFEVTIDNNFTGLEITTDELNKLIGDISIETTN